MSYVVSGKLNVRLTGTDRPQSVFQLDQTNCGELVYQTTPFVRQYTGGRFDVESGMRIKAFHDLSGLDGMNRTGEIYSAKLNPEDGKFYMELPLGAMPFERCNYYYENLRTNKRCGILYYSPPGMWGGMFPPWGWILPGLNYTFNFLAIDELVQGGYRYRGTYRSNIYDDRIPTWNPRANALWLIKQTQVSSSPLVWRYDCESWVGSEKELNYKFESFGPYTLADDGDPPIIWTIYIQSPAYSARGELWRNCSASNHWTGFNGARRSDGKIIHGNPTVEWAATMGGDLIQYGTAQNQWISWRLDNIEIKNFNVSSWCPNFTTVWPSRMMDVLNGGGWVDTQAHQFNGKAVLKIPCSESGQLYYTYALISVPDLTLIELIDWRDYPGLPEPTHVRAYDGPGEAPIKLYLYAYRTPHSMLFDIEAGYEVDWRESYKWNGGAGAISTFDGTHGFGHSALYSEEFLYEAEVGVLHGDVVSFVPPDNLMHIADGWVEEVEGVCSTDHYKAEATFVVRNLITQDAIEDAAVTVSISEQSGEGAPSVTSQTKLTNASGQVSFQNPNCVNGEDGLTIAFTVIDVEKTGLTYRPEANKVTTLVFENTPSACCAATFSPDPAQLQSGFPFQGQVGVDWYHIMVARQPSVDPAGCFSDLEYMFECEDNPGLNSPWRGADVSGTFPDGRSQVGRPFESWAAVDGGSAPYNGYKWRVKYRMKDCTEESEPSSWTSIQNP